MTSAAAPILSVHYDERGPEWRTYIQPKQLDRIVEDILANPPADAPPHARGHRELHLGHEPYNPLNPPLDRMMLIAVGDNYGAVYYRDIDNGNTPRGYVTINHSPPGDAPRLAFNANGSIEFDPANILPKAKIREILLKYLTEGEKPDNAAWEESEWVQ